MLTKGEGYTDQGQDDDEKRYRGRVLRALSQRADKLGMLMVHRTVVLSDRSLGMHQFRTASARRVPLGVRR